MCENYDELADGDTLDLRFIQNFRTNATVEVVV